MGPIATGFEARAGIGWWIDLYNDRRPHSSLRGLTPDEAYHNLSRSADSALRSSTALSEAA